MKYYLGLDVGGTKTYCLVGDQNGRVLGFGRAGTGNYEYKGVEAAAVENRKAVDAALNDAGLSLADIYTVGMGVAGADLPEDYEMLDREIYTPLFGDIRRVFRNDSMAGLRGGTPENFGIVIACGTGCVCAGKNPDGAETRVGGLGPEFGDQCTGTSIGEEGIQAVWQARDGIIPPTLMTGNFVERAGCADAEELFYKLYRNELTYDDLQPMAKVVFDAAFDGDPTACDILERGGRYLGKMVNAVARKLDMSGLAYDLVMAGSVFKGSSPVLIDAMKSEVQRVSPLASPVIPVYEPVVGALLMAFEIDGPISRELYNAMANGLLEMEDRHGVSFRAE